MQKRLVEKSRFPVTDPSGQRHLVIEHAEQLRADTLEGTQWVDGLRRLSLADGRHVNVADDGTLTLASTGAALRRV